MAEPVRRTRSPKGQAKARQRGHVWEVRFTNPITGLQQSAYGPTEAAAHEARQRLIGELKAGQLVSTSNMTLRQWFKRWIATYEADPSTKPATLKNYRWAFEEHILHSLMVKQGQVVRVPQRWATRKLREITPDDVQEWVNGRLSHISVKTGQRMRPVTVAGLLRVLRIALGDAAKKQHVAYNAAALVDGPKGASKPAPVHIEVGISDRIIDAFAGHQQLAALVVLNARMGLRIGEALALTWHDFDPDHHTLTIAKEVQRVAKPNADQLPDDEPKSHLIVQPVKSAASHDVIHLPGEVVDALLAQRDRVRLARRGAGERWADPDPGLIFPGPFGELRDPVNVTHLYQRHLQRVGLWAEVKAANAHKLHSLRHAAATDYIAHTGDVAGAAALLRHSQSAITEKFYSHAKDATRRRVAEAIEQRTAHRRSGSDQAL